MRSSSWVKLRSWWNDLFKELSLQNYNRTTHRHLHSLIKLCSHGSCKFPKSSSQYPDMIHFRTNNWSIWEVGTSSTPTLEPRLISCSTGSLSVVLRKVASVFPRENRNTPSQVPLRPTQSETSSLFDQAFQGITIHIRVWKLWFTAITKLEYENI